MREKSTLASLLKTGTQILEKAGIEEARLDAWLLLEYAAGITRAYYYAHPERELSSEEEKRCLWLFEKRAERIPLQHLTKEACFMGHSFYVDEHVLIPRQDTEILTELAIKELRGKSSPGVLDMCTGSGCILISILLALEGACGVGVDVSDEALAVAEKNAAALGVKDRIRFIRSDLFSGVDSAQGAIFDLIVSNPPYIPTREIETLSPEVRLHDPRLALDGGDDGLDFYRRIAEEAGAYLKKGGTLLLETGCSQTEEVKALLQEAGYTDIGIYKDLSGLNRAVRGRRSQKSA